MGTVSKTLSLLNHLSATAPEMGLTGFMNASGFDKATTHRRLRELADAGFLEQDAARRTYRLGPAIARLGLVREQTVPEAEEIRHVLAALHEELRETVHVSARDGLNGLTTLARIDDQTHAVRVFIDPAAILPYHVTASGLAVLAFSEDSFVGEVLDLPLRGFTPGSETDPRRIRARLEDIRRGGFGVSEGEYEDGATGISAPVFDQSGTCRGAVAVAGPEQRMTAERRPRIRAALADAARRLTEARGGSVPAAVERAWSGG